jgi:hypothetical protein
LFLITGSESIWNPHSVELALWTHYVANEFKPELLSSVPEAIKKPISEQTKTDAHINGNVNQTKVLIISCLRLFLLYCSVNLIYLYIYLFYIYS